MYLEVNEADIEAEIRANDGYLTRPLLKNYVTENIAACDLEPSDPDGVVRYVLRSKIVNNSRILR